MIFLTFAEWIKWLVSSTDNSNVAFLQRATVFLILIGVICVVDYLFFDRFFKFMYVVSGDGDDPNDKKEPNIIDLQKEYYQNFPKRYDFKRPLDFITHNPKGSIGSGGSDDPGVSNVFNFDDFLVTPQFFPKPEEYKLIQLFENEGFLALTSLNLGLDEEGVDENQTFLLILNKYNYFSDINLYWVLFFTLLLFSIGFIGLILNRSNLILFFISFEIVILGISLSFVLISLAFFDPFGYIFSLILLVTAASETAIGLGLIILLYRIKFSIAFEEMRSLRK